MNTLLIIIAVSLGTILLSEHDEALYTYLDSQLELVIIIATIILCIVVSLQTIHAWLYKYHRRYKRWFNWQKNAWSKK